MPVATGFKLQGQAGPPVAGADAPRDVTGADAQTALAVVQKMQKHDLDAGACRLETLRGFHRFTGDTRLGRTFVTNAFTLEPT